MSEAAKARHLSNHRPCSFLEGKSFPWVITTVWVFRAVMLLPLKSKLNPKPVERPLHWEDS